MLLQNGCRDALKLFKMEHNVVDSYVNHLMAKKTVQHNPANS